MLDKEEARSRVRADVVAAMSDLRWNLQDLIDRAGVDRKTLKAFIDGDRWPQMGTLGRIEGALGWEPGRIAGMLRGDLQTTVGGPTQDDAYVAAPGEAAPQNVSNADVLAEVRAMREDVNALSRRVARIESGAEPVGGSDGST